MNKVRWLTGPIMIIVSLILSALAHANQEFAIWYANYVYPIFPATIGRLTGLFPFSVFEVALILIVIGAVCFVVLVILSLCTPKGRTRLWHRIKSHWAKFVRRLINTTAIIILLFVVGAGINYNRESYAYHVGITVEDSSVDELIQLYMILVERAGMLAHKIDTDADGHFVLNRDCMYANAAQAMMELNYLHGGLGGNWSYFPRAKGLFLSRTLLSNLNIGGFFSPWTMEANYNADMPSQSIPFVITHELAHVAGHMREDEANFIAYLASRNFDNIDFNYSAVYVALSYTLNALRRAVSSEQYRELFALLPEQIQRDFAAARAYWQAFQGPAADISTRVNDAYLRLNQQEDGVRSYGRMVDLLLAYYRGTNQIYR